MKDETIEIEFLEIQAQSIFEKRTLAENFPELNKLTPWNTFKLCVETIALRPYLLKFLDNGSLLAHYSKAKLCSAEF